jgi:prolipoprotein diacylglyceryl transferase
MAVIATIPSPSSGVWHLGPLPLRMYGLMLLLGIAACVWLTRRRWKAVGGDPDLVYEVALWGVLAGIVGARLYHDLTSWSADQTITEHWWGPLAVWKGGLGIWGGILFGVAAGALVVHRARASVLEFMDAVAPGLLLAQGIGRFGNYFNQELFGKPTDLPWALKIDTEHRPEGYTLSTTFQPTFLYEFLWDIAGVGLLLALSARYRFRPPALFALYVSYYTFGRFFEELLRIDPSHHIAGLRLNAWLSILLFLLSAGYFVWRQFFSERPHKPHEPEHRPAMAIPKSRVR